MTLVSPPAGAAVLSGGDETDDATTVVDLLEVGGADVAAPVVDEEATGPLEAQLARARTRLAAATAL